VRRGGKRTLRSPRAAALLAAAFAVIAAPGGAREVPYLSGHVNDTAGLLAPDVRDRIEGKLIEFERATGAQVAVLTIDSLGGDPLEDYSMRVAQTWKLGRKGVDDGVLVLVARDDHKMRIEVGYGLEAKLPDALCRRILDNVMRPSFRAGDFGGGIAAGVDAITGTLEGKDVVPKSTPRSGQNLGLGGALLFGGFLVLTLTPFMAVALFTRGPMAWFLYVFLMPFLGIFPTALFGARALAVLGAWLVGFPFFKLWLHSSAGGQAFVKAHPGWQAVMASSGSSGHGWSSGGGGFSSGGFSGGGGSFGGGGASGGW